MKTKKNLIPLFLSLLSICTFAQTNDITNQKFTNSSQFLFNEFTNGDVYFKNGNITSEELNYNVFFQEIWFIRYNKSLILKNFDEINSVNINSSTFIMHKEKIYEEIFISNNLSIIKYRKINYESASNNKGAYGTSTETSATENWGNLVVKVAGVTKYPNVQAENDIEFKMEIKYFILKENETYPLTKKKLFKLFPEKEEQIKNYIKDNKLSLLVDKDIIELFDNILK